MLEIIVMGIAVLGACIVDRFTRKKKVPAEVGGIEYLSRRAMIADLPEKQLAESFGNWYEEDKSIN